MKNKRLWVLLGILCVVCIWANYRILNMDKILASKAEKAFKKNNIEQAQTYLEQSFDLGLIDYKYRELYVNSIINSPFDTNSQEKLIKFLDYPIEDTAKLKAETFLQDFRREINRKYPFNYIAQAAYNQKLMRWSNNPVTYDFIDTQGVPEYFIKEIENAFTKWEIATDHQILFIQDKNNPNIIIKFNPVNPADSQTGKYVVAYAVPKLNLNTLVNSTINFYIKDPAGEYYSRNQVYNTALHEIVHALGFMGHSSDRDDIMHSTKDAKSVLNDERENVTQADISTLKLLYKIKPEITNDSNPSGEYIPQLVLGSARDILSVKRNEAVSYVKNAPKLAGGYIDLADTYVANKEYDKAEKALKKALKLANTNEMQCMVYYNLAVVYFYLQNYDNAEACLHNSMQYKAGDDAHYLLAEIYAQSGKKSKAVQEYEYLIANHPQNIDYSIALANFYIKDKKYMSARNVLKSYIDKNPAERKNKRLEPYGIIRLGL